MFSSSETVRIIGSTIVALTCWGIGHFGYSFALMLAFLIMNIIKAKLYSKREKRQTVLQLMALKEKESLIAQMQDLPAWVQFPDTERVEWINKVLFQLWPYIGEYVRKFVIQTVEPQVKDSMPGPFKKFAFDEIDMGDVPTRIVGIKTYTNVVGRDRIIMDVDLVYAGDCEFIVSVGAFGAGLRSVRFKGKLRLILTPLLAQPPMVGGVRAFFMDDPDIDFDLTGIGEVVELPGLMGAIRNALTAQIHEICVVSNEIAVPLIEEMDITKLLFSEPDGILVIHVIEARQLEGKDLGMIISKGKSDPYAVCTIGSQTMKTKVVKSNLNPTWDEYFEAVVDVALGQKLMVCLYDEDMDGNDDELGYIRIDIAGIKDKGKVDDWYPLEGAKYGETHLELFWMNLGNNLDLLKTQILPSKILHPAMLMVYVDSISDLPRIKKNADPHPFVEITLGGTTKTTRPRIDTCDPIFQRKFMFWVEDPRTQILSVEAKDKETDRSLGEVSITLGNILKEKDLEIHQQAWLLTLPASVAKILMTLRLRVCKNT